MLTDTLHLLERLRADRAFAEVRLTPLVLIARAVLSALGRYPQMNAKWDGEAGEIVQYRDVNLGVAAATARGLLVPNIKAAQQLSTRELCDALDDLITAARAGKTQPDSMTKGTFTITNIGVFGVDGGTPILNPGEAGILCVGQIARRPWEYQGKSPCAACARYRCRSTIGSSTVGWVATSCRISQAFWLPRRSHSCTEPMVTLRSEERCPALSRP